MKILNPHSFQQSINGNITVFFAMTAVTLLTAIGGALDIGMSTNTKAKMQNALDAAATAVCYSADKSPDETLRDRLGATIGEFGLELLPEPEEGEPMPNPTGGQAIVLDTGFDPDTGALTPTLQTNIPTTLLKLVGMQEIAVDVKTSVSCMSKKMEISLMLDVSGSMSESVNGEIKINSMKQAAMDVVDIFRMSLSMGTARIALVPFAKGVNLGSYAEAARGPVTPGISTTPGSINFQFNDWNGDQNTWEITDCVSERTGAEAYTDVPPSVAYVGRMYRQGGNCMNSASLEIVPLSSDAAVLETAINGFTTDGNTSGQIGTAWAWYTISDQWASFWPEASKPEAPNTEELIKATILMTDGRYNTQYCNGVEDEVINCVAVNGDAQSQASALCEAMKDPNGDGDPSDGVVVYTVGFDIEADSSQETLLKNCASDDDKWFFPYNGDELRSAFKSIGKSLAAAQVGYPIISK